MKQGIAETHVKKLELEARRNVQLSEHLDYLNRLESVLAQKLEADTPLSLTELLRAGRGATPDIIFNVLRRKYRGDQVPTEILDPELAPEVPELHPLYFGWYFTRDSMNFIARLGLELGESVACLGCPSVAATLHERSKTLSITLVDADKDVRDRFPSLGNLDELHIGELATFSPKQQYSVTVADPPWYLADCMRWLKQARQTTSDGGTIVMAIFPELTRPSSRKEREVLFNAARRIGDITTYKNAVVYRTPGFEKRSFKELGLPTLGDWRVGDLLLVRNVRGTADWTDLDGAHFGPQGWRQFSIEDQVVMLRDVPTDTDHETVFIPVVGCPNDTLTSVSQRDPRRGLIGLWTSRNRVASVGNVERAAEMLRVISSGGEITQSLAESASFRFLRDLLFKR